MTPLTGVKSITDGALAHSIGVLPIDAVLGAVVPKLHGIGFFAHGVTSTVKSTPTANAHIYPFVANTGNKYPYPGISSLSRHRAEGRSKAAALRKPMSPSWSYITALAQKRNGWLRGAPCKMRPT